MPKPSEIFESRRWLARVWKGGEKKEELIGTAFAINSDILLTCAHVIIDAAAEGPGEKVYIDFPLVDGQPGCYATVLDEGWELPHGNGENSAGDVALVRLEHILDIEPLPLAVRQTYNGLSFDAYGFTPDFPNSDLAHGQLKLRVGLEWVRVEADSQAIVQPGFSGAPIWSDRTVGATAMVVTRQKADKRVAYAIPLSEVATKSDIVKQAIQKLKYPLSWLEQIPLGFRDDIIPFSNVIEERTSNFTGREFVFSTINTRLNDPDFPAGYMIIRGEPGIGKSAIIAEIARRHGYAHHFNIAPQNIRSASQFLRNVCAQLILRYNLPYNNLPSVNSQELYKLLKEAAQVAKEREEKQVILLIDALDESEIPAKGVNRLDLPRTIPDNAYIIMSIRKNVDILAEISQETDPIIVDENSEENKRDVERFIRDFYNRYQHDMEHRLREFKVGLDTFVKTLRDSSEGNFMYLCHVLPDIQKGKISARDVERLKNLPKGLKKYYERHWRLMKDQNRQRFRKLQQPVLCMLATAREAVTIEKIKEWINLSELPSKVTVEEIEDVFDEWAEFLEESPDYPPRYRLYHNSFLDFLDDTVGLKKYAKARASVMREKIDWGEQ